MIYINVVLITLAVGISLLILFIIFKFVFSKGKKKDLRSETQKGNYKNVIEIAKKILAKNKDDFEAHYYLGEAYYQEGKLELALIEFKSSDKIGQFSMHIKEKSVRERLAELYTMVHNYDEALKEYALMTKKEPDNYLLNYKIGELFELKQQKNQAVKYYVNSFKLKKNFSPVLLKLGVLYYEYGKLADAKKLLEKLTRLDNDCYEGYYYLGMIEKGVKNYDKAIKYFEVSQKMPDLKFRSLSELGLV